MKPALHIIIIEDSPDDASLVLREVERVGFIAAARRVQTADELGTALAEGPWDLVLADYSLPHFSAPEALSMLWETGLDVPFIVVSGSIGEETAVQLMKDGATDYVMKDHLSRLGPVIERELRDAGERRSKRDAEKALSESERRYRLLVETQTDLIVKTDPDGRLLYANSAYCTLFGKSLEEMTGSGYQPLVHPDDLPSVKSAVAALFRPPHLCRYEERAMTVSGWRWIDWTADAELDERGAVIALVGSGRDITERKRVEEKLRESEALYQSLVRVSPMSICRKDLAGRFTFANQRFLEESSQSLADLIGLTDFDLHPPELAEKYRRDDRAVMDSGQAQEFIERRAVLGGESAIIQSYKTPIYDGAGKVNGVQISFWDITERKQVEEKLRTSESDLRQAQAVAHVGSWRWDVVHDMLTWSDEMYRIFGVAPSEPAGSWKSVVAGFIHPDDRAMVERADRAVLEKQELMSLEYRVVWPDGSVRTVLDQAGSIARDATGQPTSLVGVVLDITDRKRAEAEKEAIQAQLMQAQKMEAVGQLAGGVAHDFNNLLTGILGNVAIVRSDLPVSSPLVVNLNAAEAAARQATDLAKGLLTFGRKAVLSVKPINVADAISATLTILKQSLPATLSIVSDVEQPPWNVLADRSQISQIIINLALNARDAIKGTGTITIAIRNAYVDEEYVRTHSFARTGDFVHLSFADTGPGIPDEVREHLFEPFFTTKPAGSGTGLGLSIVYGAIKQANGWITVDSSPGFGATFDIYLPRCLEQPSAAADSPRLGPANFLGKETVLVVEDEPVVSTVAQALLKRSGCTVLAASDGASALALMRECQKGVDLILLDMTMPGMSTDDIVQAIRQIDAHVPILLTSGYTSGGTVSSMLAAGTVQGFLPKPYDAELLLNTVSRLIHTTEGERR
jgi:PAS domain S-box-containing protein